MTVVVNEAFDLQKGMTFIIQNRTQERITRFQVSGLSSRNLLSKLCNEVVKKVKYTPNTFDLVWVKPNSLNETVLDQTDDISVIGDVFTKEERFYLEIRHKEGVELEISRPSTINENEQSVFNFATQSSFDGATPSTSKSSVTFKRRAAISSESLEKAEIEKMNTQNLLKTINDQNNNGGDSDNNEGHDQLAVPHHKYRGLVNQAMTCYLNSLIQSLFMTPEFRNAMYKWKFDANEDETLSIPYQLQHLFLLLQTSDRESVETTGLTQSFGWDSSEAWQQHDIQELCRVLFDALESKFEGTDQADLIRLYEGRMKDYVQCCECSYESARDDTFMDIPITIRPFAKNTSYKSVREGLDAFVEPETLNDTNQYYCEKCAKKCDAKKGLKFTKFPYLLTLQLKRFDFDYNTLRRIKLQDRMDFPQTLDLNSFITTDSSSSSSGDEADDMTSDKVSSCPSNLSKEAAEDRFSPGPCDEEDVSSHDSGQDYADRRSPSQSAVNDSQSSTATLMPVAETSSSSASSSSSCVNLNAKAAATSCEEDVSSVDEGIDVGASSTTSTVKTNASSGAARGLSHPAATVKRQCSPTSSWNNDASPDRPYLYELFSIMVHSGSAAGGHYYAYIKSFENGVWYSFNDQSVTQVSQLEIEKTFGGCSYPRPSYSAFSSSTNAYMLMYRQINKETNAEFMQPQDFPEHIKRMIEFEREKEQRRLEKLEHEKNMCSLKLYCNHKWAGHRGRNGVEFEFHKDTQLDKALWLARGCLKLDDDVVELRNCRLVKYDRVKEAMDRSYDVDHPEDRGQTLAELLGVPSPFMPDLLLETKEDGEEFKRYLANGITLKIHVAHCIDLSFSRQFTARFEESDSLHDVLSYLAEELSCTPSELYLVHEKFGGGHVPLGYGNYTLKEKGMFRSARLFVDVLSEEEKMKRGGVLEDVVFEETHLFNILDRITNTLRIKVALPPEPQTENNANSKTDASFELAAAVHDINNNNDDDDDIAPEEYCWNENPCHERPYGPQLPESRQPPAQDDDEEGGFAAKVAEQRKEDEVLRKWSAPLNISLASDDLEMDCAAAVMGSGDEGGGRRKRTNSCEGGIAADQPPATLPQSFDVELHRKLQMYNHEQNTMFDYMTDNSGSNNMMMAVSPTSSLRCEGGASGHSTPDSLYDEVDFQQLDEDGSGVVMNSSSSAQRRLFDGGEDEEDDHVVISHFPETPFIPQYMVGGEGMLNAEQASAAAKQQQQERLDFYSKKHKAAARSEAVNSSGTSQPMDGITTTASSSWQSPPPTPSSKTSFDDHQQQQQRLEPLGSAENKIAGDKSDSYNRALEYAAMDDDSSCERCKGAGDSSATATVVSHEMKVVRDASAGDERGNASKRSSFGKSEDEEDKRRRARALSTSSNDGYQLSQEIMQKDYYFNHIASSQRLCDKTYTNQTVLDLELDKRMPMIVLRKNLARLLNRSSREICLYKICLSKQEIEMSKPLDDLRLVPHHQEYLVKYGRALKKDEYRCKIYLLQFNDAEPSKLLIDFVVQHGKTVLQTKEELCQELTENASLLVTPDRLRLRKKTYKAPDRIYLDSEVFGTDIHCHASLDFYIQLLSEPETKVSKNHEVVMCKRWRPSQLRFDHYFELTLDTSSCDSRWASLHLLRTKLAAWTSEKDKLAAWTSEKDEEEEGEEGIPLERIAVAKVRAGTFPYLVHPLEVDSEMEWCFAPSTTATASATSFTPSIDDGSVFFFKDSHEKKKELSESERNSLMGGGDQSTGIDNLIAIGEESNDNNVASTSSAQQQRPSNNSSYRREKALKIYTVDTQPKKNTRFAL